MANDHPGERRFVCGGCSLLCDDVLFQLSSDGIRFQNVCPRGENWLNRSLPDGIAPAILHGAQVPLDQAIAAVAVELVKARMPLICGLTDQSTRTQQAAICLAKHVNAVIDWTRDNDPIAWHEALQDTGRISCSVDEMRQNADLVIVWSADPRSSHPRLLESCIAELTVIDSRPSETSKSAQHFLVWNRDCQLRALGGLREAESGLAPRLDDSDAEYETRFRWLAGKIRQSKFVVFVVDRSFAGQLGNAGVNGLSHLVRSLNRRQRCCLIHLDSGSNERGAVETLTLDSGAPFGVVWREHHALFRGRDATTSELLQADLPDLVLCVSHASFTKKLKQKFDASRAKKIRVGRDDHDADIIISTGVWGVQKPGNGFRLDGTPLHLPAIVECPLPDSASVLQCVLNRVRDTGVVQLPTHRPGVVR